MRDQRNQIREDLAFSDPCNPQQWDEEEKRQRETDPGGARPCLVMDQLGQYVSNVAGQVEQRPPSLHAIPAVDGHQKVAESLDGFFRQIEYASRANEHYARVLTSAARVGIGYLLVRPQVTDAALNYQEPRIDSEGDPLKVLLDPWSTNLGGSDADFGYHLTSFSPARFERTFGKKAAKISFGDEEMKRVSDERDTILVADEWLVSEDKQNVIVCGMPNGDQVSLSEDDYWTAKKNGQNPAFLYNYSDKKRIVKWCRMSGSEVLTASTTYPATGIGIVPVYGYVSFADGRLTYCGIPRRAREPQRAYNYHMSEMRVLMSQAPKSPWLVEARSIRGLERLWDRASVDSRAYLPYHSTDPDDPTIALPVPQRMNVATNLQNHIQNAEQAKADIQAAIGMYQANLGAPSNETSGVAIDSRKQQGEASTSHFPSHLAASLTQVGKLCLDMVPRLINTRRQLRILGIDNTPSTVRVDPKQPKPFMETDDGISINPNQGSYDVRVVVGATYSTQREQAAAAYQEMIRANPQMLPIIGPLWAQSLDVPHADRLAQVLTATAPPEVRAILSPESDKQPTTAQLAAQLEQVKQALQEAIKHAQDAQAEADQAQQQLASKEEEQEARITELALDRYNAETARLKVTGANQQQIEAIVARLMQDMQRTDISAASAPAPMPQPEQEGEPQSYEMKPFPAAMSASPEPQSPEPAPEPEGASIESAP